MVSTERKAKMPLKFNDKLIAIDLPTYNVTVLPSSNGTVTATPSSGVPGTIVSLSNTPDQGYVLDGYQLTGSSLIDGDKFMIKKSDVSVQPSFRMNILLDLDFLYQAKDFDGSKIPNKAINTTFGDYLQAGTLTKNGSGSECYLSNSDSASNYLYANLTSAQVTAMKALSGTTYTWFFRVENSSGTGAIMSTRNNSDSNIVNQIRCYGDHLMINRSTSQALDLSNFKTLSTNVFKVVNSDTYLYVKNLVTGDDSTSTTSSSKYMGSVMKSFYAGASGEYHLAKFYSFAGIPRDTTAEEDEIMKNALLAQNV